MKKYWTIIGLVLLIMLATFSVPIFFSAIYPTYISVKIGAPVLFPWAMKRRYVDIVGDYYIWYFYDREKTIVNKCKLDFVELHLPVNTYTEAPACIIRRREWSATKCEKRVMFYARTLKGNTAILADVVKRVADPGCPPTGRVLVSGNITAD